MRHFSGSRTCEIAVDEIEGVLGHVDTGRRHLSEGGEVRGHLARGAEVCDSPGGQDERVVEAGEDLAQAGFHTMFVGSGGCLA